MWWSLLSSVWFKLGFLLWLPEAEGGLCFLETGLSPLDIHGTTSEWSLCGSGYKGFLRGLLYGFLLTAFSDDEPLDKLERARNFGTSGSAVISLLKDFNFVDDDLEASLSFIHRLCFSRIALTFSAVSSLVLPSFFWFVDFVCSFLPCKDIITLHLCWVKQIKLL